MPNCKERSFRNKIITKRVGHFGPQTLFSYSILFLFDRVSIAAIIINGMHVECTSAACRWLHSCSKGTKCPPPQETRCLAVQ